MAAEGDNVFEDVMVCFTQATSCGADRLMAVGQGTIRAVDSVGDTSDEIKMPMRTYQFPA